jgi:phosphotriesterase-related protein
VTFIRTVLGDIDPSAMGITYSHEHIVIAPGRSVDMNPDFLLVDADRMAAEIGEARTLGLRTVVDAMPIDAGRDVRRLAELARRTGVNVIAPTGIHHARFYAPGHWSETDSEDELADRFMIEVADGIDGTNHRAGVIKVAGSGGGLSDRDRRVFAAAATTHRRTGVPILTHCENGTGALDQIAFLRGLGVDPGHVVVSHVDKVVDRAYHRDIAAAGAVLEYDQSFRWKDAVNGTLRLVGWMLEDGLLDRVVLGMDAARQGYYHAWGGEPGLAWLLGRFSAMMEEAGIDATAQQRLLVENPARAFAFAIPTGGPS